MTTADKPRLEGLKVLVTRPKEQAQRLVETIQNYGGQAVAYPLLETRPSERAPEALADLTQTDMMIFVSRSAARYVWNFIDAIPDAIKVAVVGAGTRQELVSRGRYPDVMPMERFDSEGLLELDDLEQVEDLNVVIVRGQNGREKLKQVLTERGAIVSYAEVYQRIFSEQVLTYETIDVDAIVVTSSQALEHLRELARRSELEPVLLARQMVVIHPRIAALVKELGFKREPIVAAQASDSGILKALSSNRT